MSQHQLLAVSQGPASRMDHDPTFLLPIDVLQDTPNNVTKSLFNFVEVVPKRVGVQEPFSYWRGVD